MVLRDGERFTYFTGDPEPTREQAEAILQEGRADIAVHSMKDVPSELPPGFCISAVLPRIRMLALCTPLT